MLTHFLLLPQGPLKMMDSLEVTKARMQRKAQGGYESSSSEDEDEMEVDHDPLGIRVRKYMHIEEFSLVFTLLGAEERLSTSSLCC